MGIDGINSSTPRALDAGRVPRVPEASAKVKAPRPEVEKEPVNTEAVPRGVPQELGVQQQIPPNTRLRVDEESNRVVAQVLDENNEVIRQIPAEALLKLSAKFNRLEGLLFDRET